MSSKISKNHNWIYMKSGQHKIKWTPEEDEKLKRAVTQLGTDSWITVAMMIPGRNSKQCRERWMGHLSPSIVKHNWTVEEDQILISQHSLIGNKWTLIATMLPGRSAINVKNRWNCLKKSRTLTRKYNLNDTKLNMCNPSFQPDLNCLQDKNANKMNSIVFLPNQTNIVFEFPEIDNNIFGERFARFQEQMLM